MRWTFTCCAAALVVTTAAPALPQGRELSFTPVTPCRLLDTRPNNALQPGVARTFALRGSCGIPGLTKDGGAEANQAVALALNLVAVGPTGPGHLLAWPANQPAPNASVVNYTSLAETGGLNIANGVIVAMCDEVDVNPCAAGDISFRAHVSATHLVVDVAGYFSNRVLPSAKRYGAGAGVDNFLCLSTVTGTRAGLSATIADFADAEHVCPPGTWLCTFGEVNLQGCDTSRPDTACDYIDCTGSCHDLPADDHRGWLRVEPLGSATESMVSGFTRDEDGQNSSAPVCQYLPAWCCSRD
jgi:hypothetical protein